MTLEQVDGATQVRAEPKDQLAHKLLNLVAACSSYVGLFRDTDLDSEQVQMLDEMKEILDSAIGLSRQIEAIFIEDQS